MNDTPVPIETLLAQRAWVRDLARSLVRDENRADDLEQQAWLAALEHPPRDEASPRGWLATVLRRAMGKDRRSDARRGAREQVAARTEALPPVDDLVAHAEILERLVRAVLDLEEPYRSAVLLRYFEGLEPGEIARRTGTPVETIRSRLRRALERLRERFDAETRGDRMAWCVALVPLIGSADGAVPPVAGAVDAASATGLLTVGGIIMANKALAAVAGVLVLAGAGWFAFRPDSPTPSPAPLTTVARSNPPAPALASPVPVQTRTPAESAGKEGPFPPVDLSRCDRDLDLFGEVVDVEGKPVPGAQVATVSYPRRRARAPAGEEFWVPLRTPRTRSASDGTFSIRLRKGEETNLEVSKAGEGTCVLPACQAGERVRAVLAKATSLEVVLRDPAGKPVEGARVRLFGSGPILMLQTTTVIREGVSGSDGRVLFDALPREPLTLAASHASYGLTTGRREQVEAGSTNSLELAFVEGKAIEGKVTDSETGKPISGASVGTTMLVPLNAVTDKGGNYRLGGWSERLGSKIRAEAPDYATTTVIVSESGQQDIAMAKGDRVVGRLVGADGSTVQQALVGAFGQGTGNQRSESDQRVGTLGPDGRFAVESLRRDMSHTLVILAPGLARTLLDFQPKDGGAGTIDLGEIVIPMGNTIDGKVVDGDGAPRADVLVEIRGANADRSRLLPADVKPAQSSSGSWEGRRTDDLGRFRFPDQPAGKLTVTASAAGTPPASRDFQVVQDQMVPPIELRLGALPKPGQPAAKETLEVVVASADGIPVEGASVTAYTRGEEDGARGATSTDGRVQLANLPSGDVKVSVRDAQRESRFMQVHQTVSLPHEGDLRIVVQTASKVSGTVVGQDDKPLPGLLVQVVRASDGSSLGGMMTDDAGKFVLTAPTGQEVNIDASSWPPGKGDEVKGKLRGVNAPASGLVIRVVKAEKNRTLIVILADAEGRGVEGATVYATLAVGGRPGTARTDATGRARFEGLVDDDYRIMVVGPAPGPLRARVWEDAVPPTSRKVVPAGQEETFSFRKGVEIRGVAKMPDGTPAVGGTAFFSAADGAMNWLPVDTEGRFRAVVPQGVKLIEIGVEAKGADGKKVRGAKKGWTPEESCEIVVTLEPYEER
jgi:RNA polymerase sigma-70 factor (ECF subfamily)